MTTRVFHERISELEMNRCDMLMVDAHLHIVDFLQDSDGLEQLSEVMEASGVEAAVVFGIPVIKKWDASEPDRPHYYLDDNARCYFYPSTDAIIAAQYRELSEEKQKLFAPLLCGFNPTDRNAVFQVEKKLSRGHIWKGIGELFCRHDDLTNLTFEETSRMNHVALLPVYDLAGSMDLPVLIHQNSTSVGFHDRFEYIHELREVLDAFSGTRIVWAHCGISRRVEHKLYHRMLEEVLGEFPNLNADLSWVVYEQTVCRNGKPKQSWVDLIERFPDRFTLGSDLCGHFAQLGASMGRYAPLLSALSRTTAERIASGNARRLWGL